MGSKDKIPRKRKRVNNSIIDIDVLKESENLTPDKISKDKTSEDNNEFSIYSS